VKAPRHRRSNAVSWVPPSRKAMRPPEDRNVSDDPKKVSGALPPSPRTSFQAEPFTELPKPANDPAPTAEPLEVEVVAPPAPRSQQAPRRWPPLLIVGLLAAGSLGYALHLDRQLRSEALDAAADDHERETFPITGAWRQVAASKQGPAGAQSGGGVRAPADLTTQTPATESSTAPREETASPSQPGDAPDKAQVDLHTALSAIAALPLPPLDGSPHPTGASSARTAPATLLNGPVVVTRPPVERPAITGEASQPRVSSAPSPIAHDSAAPPATTRKAANPAKTDRQVRRRAPATATDSSYSWIWDLPKQKTFENLGKSAP
jgi:hypothetical protein